MPLHLVDKFGGMGAAIDEAKRRMELSPDTKVAFYELPKPPASLLGTLGSLFGVHERESVLDLALVRELLRDVPASLLVAPDEPQARLPFTIVF